MCTTNPEQRCDDQVTPQVSNELLSAARLKKKGGSKYEFMGSFTDLLTAPIAEDIDGDAF